MSLKENENEELYVVLQHKLLYYEMNRVFFDSMKFKVPVSLVGGVLFGLGMRNHMKKSIFAMGTFIIGLPVVTNHFVRPVTSDDIVSSSVKAGFRGFLKGGPVAPSLSFSYYEESDRWDDMCNKGRTRLWNQGYHNREEREEVLGREVLREVMSREQRE